MLKKDTKFYWDEEASKAFGEIKKAIQEAQVLKSPDYSKPFSLFSFASYHTVVVVLLQKDNEGYEHPIAFYSKSLQVAELKYEIMEKQAYALVKVVKAFRPYLVNAQVTTYVPHAAVKDILSQFEVTSKRCRWITRIQEFDLEIKITKLVRGLDLAKIMAESNLLDVEVNNVEIKNILVTSIETQPWYS